MYTCPCCGYLSFGEAPGSDEICHICFWEDDFLQLVSPSVSGGANTVSLIEAQVNYFQFSACEIQMIKHVKEPNKEDIKDNKWFPLYQKKVILHDYRQLKNSINKDEVYYWLYN